MTDFNVQLLQFSVLLPLAAAAVVLIGQQKLSSGLVNALAALTFALPVLAALWLWSQFADAAKVDGFAYLLGTDGQYGWDLGMGELFGIRLAFGLNGVSLPLFVLAALAGLAAGWHALRIAPQKRRSLYLGLLMLMQGGLLGVFASVDVLFFYFFHELALIPTFLMIGLWGGASRRTVALEVTIYLTLGAMLSLVGLVAIYANMGEAASFSILALRDYFAVTPGEVFWQQNFFGLLLLGFGILVSLFPFHSWAPRAYTTAPTPNAMLHAGVLKKFGLYGLVQIAAPLLPEGLWAWNSLLIWLALGNVLIIGWATIAQSNLRQMVAYSSVMHMGYLFLGIASVSVAGFGGAVLLMFAHGLSVALMFLLGDYIEARAQTLEMDRIGGLGPKTPVLAALFVAATFAGIGLPGFANFWGEFTVFIALGQEHLWAVALAAVGIVLSAIYGLRAVARIFFGPPTKEFRGRLDSGKIVDLGLVERVPALVLLAGLLVIGFWPRAFSDSINDAMAGTLPEQPAAPMHAMEDVAE